MQRQLQLFKRTASVALFEVAFRFLNVPDLTVSYVESVCSTFEMKIFLFGFIIIF